MKYSLLVENWNNYVKEELGSINTATVTAQAAEAEDAAAPTQTQQQSKADSVETVKDLLKNYIRDHVSKVLKTANISKDELKAMLPKVVDDAGITENLINEKKKKDDRCKRLAKQKYKKWPSAYASGAVVRCRQGKIWKKKK